MSAAAVAPTAPGKRPLNVGSQDFADHKFEYYRWLREEAPVYRGKVSVMSVYMVSRHEDCMWLLKDPRFMRNRTRATGKGRMPFPLPKTMAFLIDMMINQDEPEHLRLRTLVNKAFTPHAIERFAPRIEQLTHDLIDEAQKEGTVDLLPAYALPVPTTVIAEMVGVSHDDEEKLRTSIRVLSEGLSGWSMLRTVAWDMPKATRFLRELIARKRREPADDILTGLIEAEEGGDRLTEDEIVAMLFLLIIAGYETTAHLITNMVLELLRHPAQLARLREDPSLIDSAVEEGLRYCGPVQGTKLAWASEDVTRHGVLIPKGAPVEPILGAANRDPAVFDDPETFDIGRSPNRHLGFSHGNHFCLGAHLARLEARVALGNLIARNPNLRLAVDPSEIERVAMPLWHRHHRLPVVLG